jgi:hypothetical protein
MKSYIEDWLKRAIDKLTKEGQETTIETIPITVNKENKRTTASK